MKYIEVTICVGEVGIENITAYLMSKGIEQTVVEDPQVVEDILNKKSKYEWDYVAEEFMDNQYEEPKIKLYLEDDDQNRDLINEIKENLCTLKIEESFVDDESWKNSYKEHFKSAKITDSIVIRPSWESEKEFMGCKVIDLDPGMAFGTGDHETTSMCALMMEKYSCKDKNVLDVGTGSGILSLVAAKLGARDVLGIDIDNGAVNIANENVIINNCQNRINIIYGDLTKGIDYKGDVVVANLMAELVVMLTEHVKEHMNRNGIYISSGILTEKKQKVVEAVERVGLKVIETMDKGEWSVVVAKYE